MDTSTPNDRRALARELRAAGKTYAQIGAELGLSRERCRQYVTQQDPTIPAFVKSIRLEAMWTNSINNPRLVAGDVTIGLVHRVEYGDGKTVWWAKVGQVQRSKEKHDSRESAMERVERWLGASETQEGG